MRRDRLVLPGGVDAHCHVDQKSSSGLMTADDFFTAGVSAACGGTTTIIPFAAQHRGQSLREVVEAYHERARSRAFVDYGFHLIVSDPTPAVLEEELPALVAEGCPSLKVYMTYDALKVTDRQMLAHLRGGPAARAIVMVHAENSDAVAWATERLLAQGRTEPRHHPASRPAAAEGEATNRAIVLAELAGADVFIVHVSCREALAPIAAARARGARVWAETCPQYLVLTAADMDQPGFEMARFVCSPPLRSRDGSGRAVGCAGRRPAGPGGLGPRAVPPARSRRARWRTARRRRSRRSRTACRASNCGCRCCISEGVRTGRITLAQFVALTATNPARIYGLYPRKGTIAPGSDADLAIWDPGLERVVTQADLHDAMDDSPFEGRAVTGWPVTTIARGEVVWHEGQVAGEPGRGRFVARTSRLA